MKALHIRHLSVLITTRRWNKLAQGMTFLTDIREVSGQTSTGTLTILTGIFVGFPQSLKVLAGRVDNEHFFFIVFSSLLGLPFHLIRCKRKVTQPILKYLLMAVIEPIQLDS
jgi:hypothetical protein